MPNVPNNCTHGNPRFCCHECNVYARGGQDNCAFCGSEFHPESNVRWIGFGVSPPAKDIFHAGKCFEAALSLRSIVSGAQR